MTSAFCPFASALRRGVSRLGGTMAAFLFSLALAGCGGSGGGSGFLGDSGGNVGDGAGPGTSVVSGAEGISEERRRAMAARVAGLDLGGEDKVRTEDVQVSENPEILNQNPFATAETAPETVAEARGFVRQSVEEERKTPGYKAFEVAVPADNPLMTVAVWISETAPEEEVELPEGKSERDPEAPRKFLYVRLQVYVSTRNFAAVEGGGVEVLETQVIAVEERLPDPKPPAGADECEAAGWKAARVDGNAINCLIPLTSGGTDFEGCVLAGEFEPLCSEVFGAGFAFPPKLEGEEARYVFNCGAGMVPESANMMGATQCFSLASNQCEAGTLPRFNFPQEELNLALRTEARRGNAPLVCEALRRGADIDDDLNGTEFTALQEAVSEGHLEVAELLLANGAEVNARKEGAGPSALDLAARAKNAEIAAVLRAAEGRCFLESGGLCEETVVAGVCAAGTLSAGGLTQGELDAGMISAAEGGDADEVCEYLRRGADVEAQKSGNLRTALMVAAEEGHADVVELLLDNGAEVNRRGGNGGYGGRPNPGRWRDYPDSNWPALLYASSRGHADVVRIMLENGADVELGDDRKRRPLWEAAFYGHQDVMGLLLDNGADVDVADVWGITPLHAPGPHYGYPGDLEWNHAANVAEYLISRGANVNARDIWGRSPLDLYAGWNHPNAAAVVREAGGRCFVETGALCEVEVAAPEPVVGTVVASDTVCAAGSLSADGMTQAQLDAGLLSAAAANNMAGVCEYLRRGANVDAEGPSDTMLRETALINAAVYGRLEMARLLLNNGADVGAKVRDRGKSDMTALIYASAAGHADVVELLLDEGAEIDATDSRRRGAVYEAAHWGRLDVLELLLSRGVNAGVRDRTGETVLHGVMIGNTIKHLLLRAEEHRGNWVVFWGHTVNPDDARSWAGALEVLLTADGVEVNTRMNDGRSALDYAAQFHSGTDSGFPELAELLRNAGGRCFVRTGPLCEVAVATPEPVVSTVVASDTVCTAGSLSANGKTQAQLDAGLIAAARGNDLAGVCEYLRRGANVDAQESEWRYYKRTALMIAAMDGNLELGKLLRRNGADVNLQVGNYNNSVDAHHYQGNRRMPALHYAAGAGRKEFVEWLLSEGANVRALQALPRDALWEAAFWGRPEIVRILLTAGADANKLATGENLALWDAVHHPTHWAKYGNPRWGVSDAYARPTDAEWVTVISILAANGADVNVREPQGASPLDIAVRRGNAYYAELMREYGSRCFVETGPLCEVAVATPVTSDTVCAAGSLSANGMTERQLTDGLVSATEGNDLPKICEYLRRGANVEAIESGSCYKRTPLMIAANDGNLDAAKLLHTNGANVNRQSGNHVCGDPLAWSALMYAAAAGHLEMARWLLDSGAEIEAEWSAGVTALWEAAYWGRPEVLRLLLSRGASWAQQDGWGNTALRRLLHDGAVSQWTKSSWQYKRDALSYSYTDPSVDANVLVISLLAEAGADVNNVLNGRSVLDDAVSRGFSRYAEMLRSFGAECRVETGPLCGEEIPVAVVSTVVASDTVCTAGSLSADGLTQAQLDAGLIAAAGEGDLTTACEYLRRGANPNGRDAHQHVPLMHAKAHLDMGELLLANGADKYVQIDGNGWWSPLFPLGGIYTAAQIEFYLSRGVDPNFGSLGGGDYDWRPLHEAAFYGKWNAIKHLLDGGAVPNVHTSRPGWRGRTPLHEAVGDSSDSFHFAIDASNPPFGMIVGNSARAVSVLLAGGAEVNARDGRGYSPLDRAAVYSKTAAAAVLRAAGGRCFVRTGPLCGEARVAVEYSSSANGTVSAGVANGGEVARGATVAFTATPAEGYYVSGWTGNCASAGAVSDGLDKAAKVCSVSADADLNVGAVFAEVPSLAGTDCPAGTLPANGMTQAQLDAGLVSAVRDNNLESVCEHLRRGASPDARSEEDHPALILVGNGNAAMAELLLANGANPNLRDREPLEWTPLMYSGLGAEVIGLFLSYGADPLMPGNPALPYWHALHEAVYYDRWRVMSELLSFGADPDVWTLRRHWEGTPLHYAARHRSGHAVSVLLAAGAEVNPRGSGNSYSPLDEAVWRNNEVAARMLRDAGGVCFVKTGPLCGSDVMVGVEYSSSANGTVSADVASGGEVARGATVAFTATPAEGYYVSGWTGNCASAGAVSDGLDKAAKVCSVSADADLNVGAVFAEVPSLAGTDCPAGTLPADGKTQAQLDAGLVSAVRDNNLEKVCEHLRRGASPDARSEEDHPALILVGNGNAAMAELLLANGANPNLRDREPLKWTPLMYSGLGAEVIGLFLSYGADPLMPGNPALPYWHALHEAVYYDRWRVMSELLSFGADPDVWTLRRHWEGTPLHYAARHRSGHAVSVLLAAGAEVNPRGSGNSYSPLDEAVWRNNEVAARMLRDAGGVCFVRTGPLCGEARVAVEYSSSANGTVSADVANGGEVARGATVAFTATPAEGFYVSGWTGGCVDAVAGSVGDGGAKVCSLIAEAALSVGAVFAEVPSLAGPECPGGTMPGNGLTQAELNTQLRLAARNGDTRKICEMLRRGAEVNDNLDGNEFTALQEAVSEGHKAAAEMLLANDAHVNARKGGSGPAPLDLAAQNDNAEIAQILRDAHGQCFVATGPLCGEYLPAATLDPSTVAVTATTTATVAIEDLTCPTEPLSAEGSSESGLRLVMHRSTRYSRLPRDYARVCSAIRRGANPNDYADKNGDTPLHRVFQKSSTVPGWTEVKLAMVELLIERGADVDAVNEDGATPLHVLVDKHCMRRSDFCRRGVELLIDSGADGNGGNSRGWTPMHIVAWMMHDGRSPEMVSNLNRISEALIRGGANVNAASSEGPTPLLVASWTYGNLQFFKTLIDNGAEVNVVDDIGWTPLHWVVDAKWFEGVSLLVESGANVNVENDFGDTPLQMALFAASKGKDVGDIVALLESAASPSTAVVPESDAVPESVTEELQEDFQAAFNPAPAFGDAFGAAASPGRFLTRLDSLMRATAGTGDVWDSFYGWQKENDFGRVWFSTGQRGDFGFGAGSLGGGESGFGKVLDANPFAALSGNGMLAGGEAGFGESGKVRVAAFGDYESQSLLSGEDGKWTRWAASGTAIETAMSEAERFSGLSENKTRGAMTEFHLGGADVGVALQAGAVSESESALGGTARNESLRGLRSRTAFAGLSGSAALLGTGWRLRGAAHVGRSWAESDGMLRSSDLWASAFSAGLERGGWFYSDDGFVLRFSQPLRVEIWERELANDNGVRRMGISPSGRQLDVDAAYRLPLSGGGWLLFSAGVRRDGGHSSGSGVEGGALFAVEKGF